MELDMKPRATSYQPPARQQATKDQLIAEGWQLTALLRRLHAQRLIEAVEVVE